MRSSATRTMMYMPEIRSHIFSFSTPKTNLSNALVCRRWCDDALNALWSEVEGPGCLLQLLAPLHRNQRYKFEFARCLSPDDWVCFDKYAWRVNSLDEWYDEGSTNDDAWRDYDPTVLIQLAATRPRSELLPNLRSLYYVGPPQFISMFLSPCLETLRLSVPSDLNQFATHQVASGMRAALLFISKISPSLQTLLVNFDYPWFPVLEWPLARSLSGLPALTRLHLPGNWLTERVTHAVASHANLYAIHSIHLNYSDPLSVNDIFSPELDPEGFPSLQELLLAIPFSRAAECLSADCFPSTLTFLHLTSPTPDSLDDIAFLVEAVAGSCPRLTRLQLSARLSGVDLNEQVDFGTISPLLNCTQLRFLGLHHPIPFALTSDDVVAIVKRLPLLEYLDLNSGPTQLDPPTLPFSTLRKLPHFCPNLRYLALYVDATAPIEEITDIHIPRFSRLTAVSICRSPISSPLLVAEFLGRILPATADISLGVPMTEEYNRWLDVSRFLKALLKIREEQRQRSMSLKDHC